MHGIQKELAEIVNGAHRLQPLRIHHRADTGRTLCIQPINLCLPFRMQERGHPGLRVIPVSAHENIQRGKQSQAFFPADFHTLF